METRNERKETKKNIIIFSLIFNDYIYLNLKQKIMIIKSILDLDLYKLTMAWAVMQKYPNYVVEYEFQNRSKHQFRHGFDIELKKEIISLSKLALTEEEEFYLRNEPSLSWLPELFIQWLKGYRYDQTEISIFLGEQEPDNLKVKAKGYWFRSILWETTIMSIISELNFKDVKVNLSEVSEKATKKAHHFYMNDQNVAEMGTRRRKSYDVQDAAIQGLLAGVGKKSIVGTSNVHFAMKYNIKPIGTMAHEWISAHGALYGYKMANHRSSEAWSDVYKGDLGIFLPDTFTTDVFLRSFDTKKAKTYDGVRHDSGDPIEFGDKIISHYEKLGIDPKSKTIIFSDGLDNHDLIDKIQNHFNGRIKISFGIGTWLSFDIDGVNALKMVIKMVRIKIHGLWVDVVKLSDNIGKHSGNKSEIVKSKLMLDIISLEELFLEKEKSQNKELNEIKSKLKQYF